MNKKKKIWLFISIALLIIITIVAIMLLKNNNSQQVTYTVTFYNSDVSPVTVNSGDLLTEPNPTVEGYYIDGWYLESSFTTQWVFSTDSVTSNLTLYPKWEALLSITVKTSADDEEPEVLYANSSNAITFSPTPCTKTDYALLAYFIDQNGNYAFDETTEEYDEQADDWITIPGETFCVSGDMLTLTQNIIICPYFISSDSIYTVIITGDGVDDISLPMLDGASNDYYTFASERDLDLSYEIYFPENTATKDGYVFDSYYIDVNNNDMFDEGDFGNITPGTNFSSNMSHTMYAKRLWVTE